MTACEVADHLHARRTGRGRWVARCPHHNGKGRGLSITEGKTGVLLRCWSRGCAVEDICKAAGLTLSSLFYASRERIDPKAAAEAQRIRTAQDAAAWRTLVRQYVHKYRADGYHTYEDDLTTSIAVAQIMEVEGEKEHLQKMLRTAMARIAAYGVCLKQDERMRL